MKKINKKEPEFFQNYIKSENPTSWKKLSKAIGKDIRNYMLSGFMPDGKIKPAEQNNQCAYTELHIEPDTSSSHIDHFRKQSMFPKEIFKWTNLFTVCNNENYGAKYKDKNIRQDDYKLLINPALENPKEYLTYTLNGHICEKSSNKNSYEYLKANKTIELFNLKDYSLQQQRLAVAYQVKAMCDQLSVEEIKKQIGRFDSFVEFVYDFCKNN